MSDTLRRAVDFAGGATQLAHALGVSHQAVHKWLKRGWVSPSRALELSEMYGLPAAAMIRPELLRALTIVSVEQAASDLV
jgi:DNA-binding transcriptional regulator YdaS (Cro superfamily)